MSSAEGDARSFWVHVLGSETLAARLGRAMTDLARSGLAVGSFQVRVVDPRSLPLLPPADDALAVFVEKELLPDPSALDAVSNLEPPIWVIVLGDSDPAPANPRRLYLKTTASQTELEQILGLLLDLHVWRRRALEYGEVVRRPVSPTTGRLAGCVAHDLKNLVTAIFGYADLMSLGLPPESGPNSPLHEDVSAIRDLGRKAAHLSQQLSFLAGQQNFCLQWVNLGRCAEAACQKLRGVCHGFGEVSVDFSQETPPFQADPNHLEQAIKTLLMRLVESSVPSGVKLRTLAGEREAILEISGTGLSREVARLACHPLGETSVDQRASHLDLSVVAAIVAQLQGKIEFHDEEPTVVLRLRFPEA